MISRLLYLTKKQPAEQSHILQYLTEHEGEQSAAAAGGNLRASVVFPSLRGDKKGLGDPCRDDGSRHLVGIGWCVKVFWILGWAAGKIGKVSGVSPISSPGAFLQLIHHRGLCNPFSTKTFSQFHQFLSSPPQTEETFPPLCSTTLVLFALEQ